MQPPMVFSSVTFLFFFLPAVIGIYYLCPRPLRNLFLVLASLVFYIWGAGTIVFVLVASIGLNYVVGLAIERAIEGDRRRRAQWALAAGAILNVAILVWFKYATFATAQLNEMFGTLGAAPLPVLQILLPIGISFYTFHSLSYLVDIYRGTARHLVNPIDFALYITFFPQLVAGPIVRFHEIRDQLVTRTETSGQFARGVYRFAHGLAKKALIADTVAPVANAVFATPTDQLTAGAATLGVVAYAVQLYFDFSGYSDMALGLAGMFGIRLPENFNRPYASRSITEFWRRWHMSLSRWFRDYLYLPLGGNRGSRLRTYRNLIVVFVVTGIWHGANWTFVAWGAYHGVLLLIERALGIGRNPDATPTRLGGAVAQARTIVLVLVGWILFRSTDIGQAVGYLGAFTRLGAALPYPVALALDPLAALCLVVGSLSVVLPRTWVTGVRLEGPDTRRINVLRLATLAVVLPIAFVFVVSGTFSPFLYFQF